MIGTDLKKPRSLPRSRRKVPLTFSWAAGLTNVLLALERSRTRCAYDSGAIEILELGCYISAMLEMLASFSSTPGIVPRL